MGGAGIALMAILIYLFTSKKFLIALGLMCVFILAYIIIKSKKRKTDAENFDSENTTSDMSNKPKNSKIKLEGYHPMFLKYDTSDIRLTESSTTQDCLFFIKNYCHDRFFYFVPLAFRGIQNFEGQFDEIYQSDIFPNTGRTHIFLAFKNLGKENNISEFSIAFKDFFNEFRSNLLKINESICNYRSKFREMSAVEHVNLYNELESKYDGLKGSNLYEQVCIFEDEYLHKQYDFFEDDLFFEDWWNHIALDILDK